MASISSGDYYNCIKESSYQVLPALVVLVLVPIEEIEVHTTAAAALRTYGDYQVPQHF